MLSGSIGVDTTSRRLGYAPCPISDERCERPGSVGYTRQVTRSEAPSRGWFITIEGPEGAGKTTQAAAIARHLVALGLDVHTTREPGGTWLGERLRDILLARTDSAAPTDPLTDALLFNAARRQLVTEVIRPAPGRGRPSRIRLRTGSRRLAPSG